MEKDSKIYSESEIMTVPFRHLIKMVDELKDNLDIETDISFEFIIGSLFPDAMNNIRAFGVAKYIEGYNAK